MANTTFTKTLSLMAYENNLTPAGTDPPVGILLTSVEDVLKTFFITPYRVNPNEPRCRRTGLHHIGA